jgi:hypothetical protein
MIQSVKHFTDFTKAILYIDNSESSVISDKIRRSLNCAKQSQKTHKVNNSAIPKLIPKNTLAYENRSTKRLYLKIAKQEVQCAVKGYVQGHMAVRVWNAC